MDFHLPITIFGANTWTFTYLIGGGPRLCFKYSNFITVYGFEAGQNLVRSRSNYFAHDGKRALNFSNDRKNCLFSLPKTTKNIIHGQVKTFLRYVYKI